VIGLNGELNRTAADLHIIFPPQWSPFQPFLSSPSLKAYLERRGHRVVLSDWNIEFYHYFIGLNRLALARRRLEHYAAHLENVYDEYRARSVYALAFLENYHLHRSRTARLHDPTILESLNAFRESVASFRNLLGAFSIAEPVIHVETSSLSVNKVLADFETFHKFLFNRRENPFIDFYESLVPDIPSPRYFGISIIGQEQIVPGLTLGITLKKYHNDIPVIVGGSVFSRLVDREDIRGLFGLCLDYVCRYEGERPMDIFLRAHNPRTMRTPNLAFLENDKIIRTEIYPPISMEDVPTPDFGDLNLQSYFSPHVVLPLLTTRGCYWGKCAFCYHGMIYQDRYRMRRPERIVDDVEILNDIYGARHFAFNDEAIPPKIFRQLPKVMPRNKFYFTGLYKFEKYFKPSDFQEMYNIGFRSLYVGLESVSERVLKHMRKNTTQAIIIQNLQDAHNSGIWNHTFNFFGFPTETVDEAWETIQFLLTHAGIIHSEGTALFSLEHNTPIHLDPKRYGVTDIISKRNSLFELYYDYHTRTGITADQASLELIRFADEKKRRTLFRNGRWIPREHLLLLLSIFSRNGLREQLDAVENMLVVSHRIGDTLRPFTFEDKRRKVNRHFVAHLVGQRIFETNRDTVVLLECVDPNTDIETLVRAFPALEPFLV